MNILNELIHGNFDPTDPDGATCVAMRAVALLRSCQKILDSCNNGLRPGRDELTALAVDMRLMGQGLKVLPYNASSEECDTFHRRCGY